MHLGQSALGVVKIKRPERKQSSGQSKPTATRKWFFPSFIRTLPSTLELHQIIRHAALVGFTTDRELRVLRSPCPEGKY
jgi:hypothetical protein